VSAVEQALIKYATSSSGTTSASGDTSLVVVPASKRFKLISAIISAPGGANNIILKAGAVATPTFVFAAAAAPLVLNYNPAGWIFGPLDGDFIINLSAATAANIVYTYFLWDS